MVFLPDDSVAAPKEFWDHEWQGKFVNEANVVINEPGVECLKSRLSFRLKQRWAEMARKTMSTWIGQELVQDEAVLKADRESEYDYALLSHWIWSGYGDVAGSHDVLAQLIEGTASGPTLVFAVELVTSNDEKLVWETPEAYLEGVDELVQVLRSDSIKEVFSRSSDNFEIGRLLDRIDGLMADKETTEVEVQRAE